MSGKPKPLNELSLRQVTGGISQNLQQPANAAKFLNQLLTDLNMALDRITELECKVDDLAKPKSKSADKKLVGALDSI
jgi:hypothetical protein